MMRFRINVKGKVIHGPDCGEECNLDQVDELRTVSFSAAAMLRCDQGFAVCDRLDPEHDRPKDDAEPVPA